MRRLNRVVLIFYASMTLIFSLLSLLSFLSNDFLNYLSSLSALLKISLVSYISLIIFFSLLFLLSLYTIFYYIQSGRMSQTRLRVNENGVIDISVSAIENIALNSAKTSQIGIKTAKARVSSDQNRGVRVDMLVHLYSDIEIPTQMAKIQERVKKDIERFTSIPVTQVSIKVLKIEPLGVRVENT